MKARHSAAIRLGAATFLSIGFLLYSVEFLSTSQRRPASVEPGFVELIVVPPYRPQNWSTPRKLLKSQIANAITIAPQKLFAPGWHKSSTGHGMIHFKCESSTGPLEEWTGFSGDGDGKGTRLVFKEKAGLGVLLYEFPDGHVQSPDFVQNYITESSKVQRHKPRFMKMPISREQCDLMACHLKAFRAVKAPTYGFTPDPLKYEGAGCTSYATSFLQVAGLYEPEFDRWWRKLVISSRLVGKRSLQKEHGAIDSDQPGKVGWLKVLALFKKSKWRAEGTSNYELNILDPQLMVDFVDDVIQCAEDETRCSDRRALRWVQAKGARKIDNAFGPAIELASTDFFDRDHAGTQACPVGSTAGAAQEAPAGTAALVGTQVEAPSNVASDPSDDEHESSILEAIQKPESIPAMSGALEDAVLEAREKRIPLFFHGGFLYTP